MYNENGSLKFQYVDYPDSLLRSLKYFDIMNKKKPTAFQALHCEIVIKHKRRKDIYVTNNFKGGWRKTIMQA